MSTAPDKIREEMALMKNARRLAEELEHCKAVLEDVVAYLRETTPSAADRSLTRVRAHLQENRCQVLLADIAREAGD